MLHDQGHGRRSREGHSVIRYLHSHRSEGCMTQAMGSAAMKRYGDVVRFLHENRGEGCMT